MQPNELNVFAQISMTGANQSKLKGEFCDFGSFQKPANNQIFQIHDQLH